MIAFEMKALVLYIRKISRLCTADHNLATDIIIISRNGQVNRVIQVRKAGNKSFPDSFTQLPHFTITCIAKRQEMDSCISGTIIKHAGYIPALVREHKAYANAFRIKFRSW